MFINIDPSSGLPIYMQIVQQIKTAVAMGRLQTEDPLPSVRQLAVELKVNPNTVARAYLDLEIEGVIYKRQGHGTFVSGQGVEMSKRERRKTVGRHLEKAVVEAVHLGLDEEEMREAFDAALEKIMSARGREAVGK
ncbi:MAG TPA: GntR family transcriptional regulator [Pyrinomonadaceae bacterium]|nr:GntR family transcriptional regulator [Pyrinomonadaceae bacterium]